VWGGNIRFHAPMLYALGFVSLFVIGGLSGVFLAAGPVDIPLHDTYFVVAHIHYVLVGGSLFGIFAAVTFWYPKMFGRMMNETLGKIHFALTFIFFNTTFFPMHMLGSGGMMRRLYDPTHYPHLQPMQDTNIFITISALLLFASQLIFMFNFLWNLGKGKRATENPWEANSLEWTAPSPPPHGNWGDKTPVVYRGPYEYSAPEAKQDYWLQTDAPAPGRPATVSH
jgi:cytochrome c oxidase subunit 1